MLIYVPVQVLGYVTNLKGLIIPLIEFNCSELDRLTATPDAQRRMLAMGMV